MELSISLMKEFPCSDWDLGHDCRKDESAPTGIWYVFRFVASLEILYWSYWLMFFQVMLSLFGMSL